MKLFALVLLAVALPAVHPDDGNPFELCGDAGFCNLRFSTCENATDGGNKTNVCVCFDGYTGENCNEDKKECEDDICGTAEDGFFCVEENAPTKYKCGCLTGYTPVLPESVEDPVDVSSRPTECIDIDECANATLFDCDEGEICTNTPGSYNCTPPPTAAPTAAPTADPTPAPTESAGSIVSIAGALVATGLLAYML